MRLDVARRSVEPPFLWLVNATVMLTFNVLYLLAVLENTPYLTLVQAALALFKFGWNQLTAMFAMSRISLSKKQRTVDVLLLSLQVFNFVVAPCIATAVSDSNCFYELFNRQPAQAGSADGACVFIETEYVDGTYQPVCVESTGSINLAQPFNPPFVYHYQCSSALIVNYVPVILYAFLFGSVGVPAALLLCLRYRAAILRRCPLGIISNIFPRLYTMEDDMVYDVVTDDNNSRSKYAQTAKGLVSNTRQTAELALSNQEKKPLFRGGLFMNKLMLHVVVLMTFGLASPYLAFIITCSFFAELSFMRLLVGRYLSICCSSSCSSAAAGARGEVSESPASSQNGPPVMLPPHDEAANRHQFEEALLPLTERSGGRLLWRWSNNEGSKGEIQPPPLDPSSVGASSSSPLLLAAALCEVEEALEGVWAYPYNGMWLVVLVAQLFWAVLFFDMVGDVYGYKAGLQVMLATMLCLPLLTYWLVRFGLHCKPYCNRKMWSDCISVDGAQRDAAEPETSSMKTRVKKVGHVAAAVAISITVAVLVVVAVVTATSDDTVAVVVLLE